MGGWPGAGSARCGAGCGEGWRGVGGGLGGWRGRPLAAATARERRPAVGARRGGRARALDLWPPAAATTRGPRPVAARSGGGAQALPPPTRSRPPHHSPVHAHPTTPSSSSSRDARRAPPPGVEKLQPSSAAADSPAAAAALAAAAAGPASPAPDGLVAVKVQYPGAAALMAHDITHVRTWARFLSKTEIAFDLVSAVDELDGQVWRREGRRWRVGWHGGAAAPTRPLLFSL